MFIYVIVCSETLKIYVGQHKGVNLQKYLQTKQSNARRNSGTRSHLFAAMRKHPRESWSIHPLVSGIECRTELDALETRFIQVLKSRHPEVGYNICRGGEGFTGPHTSETIRKMSEAHKKLTMQPAQLANLTRGAYTPERAERNRVAQTGKHASEETKARLSAAGKAAWARTPERREISWNRGKVFSNTPNAIGIRNRAARRAAATNSVI